MKYLIPFFLIAVSQTSFAADLCENDVLNTLPKNMGIPAKVDIRKVELRASSEASGNITNVGVYHTGDVSCSFQLKNYSARHPIVVSRSNLVADSIEIKLGETFDDVKGKYVWRNNLVVKFSDPVVISFTCRPNLGSNRDFPEKMTAKDAVAWIKPFVDVSSSLMTEKQCSMPVEALNGSLQRLQDGMASLKSNREAPTQASDVNQPAKTPEQPNVDPIGTDRMSSSAQLGV